MHMFIRNLCKYLNYYVYSRNVLQWKGLANLAWFTKLEPVKFIIAILMAEILIHSSTFLPATFYSAICQTLTHQTFPLHGNQFCVFHPLMLVAFLIQLVPCFFLCDNDKLNVFIP